MSWFGGRQPVWEILNSGKPVRQLLVSRETEKKNILRILQIAEQRKINVNFVPKETIESLTLGHHQGIAIEIESETPLDFKSFLKQITASTKSFVCLLDEIQDPQNLGAIIRSAVCFGCSGIILPTWRSASVNETVMKSSSGAAVHLPVVQIANLGVAIERLKEKGVTVYGTDPSGKNLNNVSFEFPLAIVLGNEHRGIKPIFKNSCDKLVSIPQLKTISSLNVSNAAAIIFYEIFKNLNLR